MALDVKFGGPNGSEIVIGGPMALDVKFGGPNGSEIVIGGPMAPDVKSAQWLFLENDAPGLSGFEN